jgi:hypothetical protein
MIYIEPKSFLMWLRTLAPADKEEVFKHFSILPTDPMIEELAEVMEDLFASYDKRMKKLIDEQAGSINGLLQNGRQIVEDEIKNFKQKGLEIQGLNW